VRTDYSTKQQRNMLHQSLEKVDLRGVKRQTPATAPRN